MGERVKERVAIVTGSGRGIGREVALWLARDGAKIVVNDLGGSVDGSGDSATPADQVVEEIKALGGEAVACYDSVANYEGAQNIVKTAVDNFGRIDILCHPAGILRDRMIFNMTEEEWDAVLLGWIDAVLGRRQQQRWGLGIDARCARLRRGDSPRPGGKCEYRAWRREGAYYACVCRQKRRSASEGMAARRPVL